MIQEELFKRQTIQPDQGEEFIRDLLRACERLFSLRTIKEGFNAWEIEKEMEKEMERAAEEEGIEEDDF
jgi:hypothetical protein